MQIQLDDYEKAIAKAVVITAIAMLAFWLLAEKPWKRECIEAKRDDGTVIQVCGERIGYWKVTPRAAKPAAPKTPDKDADEEPAPAEADQ